MGLFDTQDTHAALKDLLIRERTAILSGDYSRLEAFGTEKERLMNALSKVRTDPKILADLREKAARNGLLYDAMRAGVGSALERLKQLREPAQPLSTYDKAGRKTEIASEANKTVRRA